ncbi:MAG: pitrilysin family protein [Myxococcales bacterium]|nr:insulinase family protein [Polyangiaceae bacterium]MDW8249551.1 pitrilysin family protein [Myxococcales bacterium]
MVASRTLLAAALAAALCHDSSVALAQELSFTRTRLKNNLTVIFHEDHTLPQVAVNLIYRVGSRDEEPKRTGFAHLFEHLMFMGTTRVPPKMFDAWMESAGGSNNAWTSSDLTDYHEIGPTPALPLLLWLEADRLATLGQEIDQPRLDLQRDVVRNERRQTSENVPYGKVELRLPELLYPPGHPYHHPVIGSHEDLEAASVADVRAFFAKYYVPSNASLVIAGDIRPEETRALVERYFEAIPAGQRPARQPPFAPRPLGKVVRETIQDRVEFTKIVVAYHSPARFAPGDAEMDLLAAILTLGKSSRLYKSLVYDQPLAQSVEASQGSQDLSSVFTIEVLVRDGVDPDKVEKALDAALSDVLAKGITADELQRARNAYEFGFIDRLQSLPNRARLLNLYEVTAGDPGFLPKDLARYRNATTASIHEWAKSTLKADERVMLRVVPQEKSSSKGGKR